MNARAWVFAIVLFVPWIADVRPAAANGCDDPAAVAATRARAEANCPCATATNHGQYVRCVRRIAREDVERDTDPLPKECKRDVTECAAHSTCGKPGFVTCCVNRPGSSVVASRCRISSSATQCQATGGTSGGPGSCCDTCFGGGTTTTTITPVTTTTVTTGTAPSTTSTTVTITATSTTSTTVTITGTSTTSTTVTITATSTTGTTGTATTTSSTSSTLPGNCGNFTVDPGEDCDPPNSSTCGAFLGGLCDETCHCPTTTTTTPTVTTTSSTGASTTTLGSTTTQASTTTVPSTTTLGSTTTVATSTTVSSTTSTTLGLVCCEPGEIVTSSSAGILLVSTLAPFPFPAGVLTTIDVGPADATCKHNVVVPAGGFSVPVFCIPALGFTSQVEPTGCESGTAIGSGMVWDDAAPCPDADVSRVGDTSDPDANNCGTLGTGCLNPPVAGSAGFDTAGNINTTRGDGVCDLASGVHTQLDIPVLSTTWNDIDGNCPDDDLMYDPGTDTLVTQFNFILSPTTASSFADYTDLNADACSFAGNGPDHTKHCTLDLGRPCATNGHCTNPAPNAGTCVDGPIVGTPAPGPCCTTGQSTTVVATGIAFTGGAPLYDILFANQTPSSITACNAAPATQPTCTLTTNPCMD